MQHEPELIFRLRALVVVRHAPVGVLRALADVLTADERELHRARIVVRGSRARAPDAAPMALLIDEPVPRRWGRAQSADEHAAGVIGGGERARSRRRDHA